MIRMRQICYLTRQKHGYRNGEWEPWTGRLTSERILFTGDCWWKDLRFRDMACLIIFPIIRDYLKNTDLEVILSNIAFMMSLQGIILKGCVNLQSISLKSLNTISVTSRC